MATKLFAIDDLGGCTKVELRPYPNVVSGDAAVDVDLTVGSDGKYTYSVDVLRATDTLAGITALATAENYPQHSNDIDAVTPAYLKEALDDLVPNPIVTSADGTVTVATSTNSANGQITYSLDAVNATTSVRGVVALATAADYPQNSNDVDAATPAYVRAAIDDRNDDFSPVFSTVAALLADGRRGGTVNPAWVAGGTLVIPDGTITGQRVNLVFSGGGIYEEMRVSGQVAGLARNGQHEIVRIGAGTDFIVRSGEAMQLVWDVDRWRVISYSYRLHHEGAWHETVAGQAEQRFTAEFDTIAAGEMQVLNVALPIQVSSTAMKIFVEDFYGATVVPVGNGAPSSEAASVIFAEASASRTVNAVRLIARNVSGQTAAVGSVQVIAFGTTPAYDTLGGIASF